MVDWYLAVTIMIRALLLAQREETVDGTHYIRSRCSLEQASQAAQSMANGWLLLHQLLIAVYAGVGGDHFKGLDGKLLAWSH